MGEIKFRVWDKKKRIMIKPDYIGVNNSGDIFYYSALADNWCTAPNPEDVVLLQYTGLKDCNGKEIYEGDIVKSPLGIGMVFMRLGCWYIENQKELGYFSAYEIEVIGNVYENPELLGGKLNETN